MGGNLIETLKLKSILSRIVKNNFKILLLSPTGSENEISILEWGIDHVFTLQVSNNYLNKRTWYMLLKGIHLNSKI